MFLSSRVLFLFTETPLHAGAGMALGVVDLPIQRERSTGYPLVQASGLKGALRNAVAGGSSDEVHAVFGPDPAGAREGDTADEAASAPPLFAGAISPGDARLLLFPVRSLTGVFAWTTSLDVLNRFRRDAQAAGLQMPELPSTEPPSNAAYMSGQGVTSGGTAVLEEYAFDAAQDSAAEARTRGVAAWLAENALPQGDIYDHWRGKLRDSLVILPQDAFRDFVMHATEVVARIRLQPDTKTVAQGALWTEEHLPADSLLYAPIHATRLRTGREQRPRTLRDDDPQQEAEKVLQWISNARNLPEWIQIGGDETVGRGIVRLRWAGGAS